MASIEYFTLLIVTWNLGGQSPPSGLDLKPLLGLPQAQPDIYVIGLQEIKTGFYKYFEYEFSNELLKFDYCLFEKKHLENIGMFIFVKQRLQPYLTNVEKDQTTTGILNLMGNKGATVICLDIFQIYTCFVNSHLNAFEENTERRVQDIERIEKGKLLKEGANALIFWFGDLNFRLENEEIKADYIIQKLKDDKLGEMFSYDELTKLRKNKGVFHMFEENKVTFPPTYKFKIGTSEYDSERRPAWTDRILYRDGSDIVEQMSYDSFPNLEISDHKPVIAYFEVKVDNNDILSKEKIAKKIDDPVMSWVHNLFRLKTKDSKGRGRPSK